MNALYWIHMLLAHFAVSNYFDNACNFRRSLMNFLNALVNLMTFSFNKQFVTKSIELKINNYSFILLYIVKD